MDSRRKLVLVIDDDRSLADLLDAALGRLGYDCAFAQNGRQAVELLDSITPDVVLCDYELPGELTAPEIFHAVAEMTDARFVLMSGHRAVDIMHELPEGTPMLPKPFGLDGLREVIAD